ncbi:MAG: sialate O-acetylesterase [Planctomycetota bacterium]
MLQRPSLLTWLTLTLAAQALGGPAPVDAEFASRPIVRVFLLAGQSNMEGHGVVDLDDPRDYNGGRGTLVRYLAEPDARARWPHLLTAEGSFAIRDDVFVSYRAEHGTQKCAPLSVGLAVYDDAHHFGPELGIGHALGERFEEPVLLVKTAWGGKSLAHDFRPPSAGGETGPYYTRMLAELARALESLDESFPALAGHMPQLDGVIWFQGWNDGCDEAATRAYEANCVHLIQDVRAALGDAALPFVVGETGNMDNAALRAAQAAACARPEVARGARFVPTRAFLRRAEDSPNTGHGHHWFGNAESYLLAGDALGRAAAALVAAREVRVATTEALGRALTEAGPGTRVLLAPGEYKRWNGDSLSGEEGAPLVVRSADPARPATFVGGVHLSRVAHLELRDLRVVRAPGNGVNIDDGGTFDAPSHHVVLRDLVVLDTGRDGNEDGIKLSGVEDFRVIDCRVERWGGGGSAIDMVGCHRGELRGCVLRGGDERAADRPGATGEGTGALHGASGVQIKGGSADIAVLACRFERAGARAVNLGGSTGLEYFRPALATIPEGARAEARDLRVEGCTFLGSEAPIAFVGVVHARVAWNTLVHPSKWAARILQETRAPGFLACRDGEFTDNLIVYRSHELAAAVNVGPDTLPETFQFARNRWVCEDDPKRPAPRLPAPDLEAQSGPAEASSRPVGADAWPLR